MNSIYSDHSVKGVRFLTFIDLMGFKNLVSKESPSIIYEKMAFNYRKIEGNVKAKWFYPQKRIDYITFSDSIVLYTEDDTPESLCNLVCGTSSLSYDLFVNKMPHKGALAKGYFTSDVQKSIFFGKPFIDAFELQNNLFYYGIIFQEEANNYYNDIVKISKTKIPFLLEYFCPMKSQNEMRLTIFPIYSLLPPNNNNLTIENDKGHHKAFYDAINSFKNDENNYINSYYKNTVSYFEYLKNNYSKL